MSDGRRIVLGRNSAVWKRMSNGPGGEAGTFLAIGHREVDGFAFEPGDSVLILSYAPEEEANRRLFERLRARGARRVVYVSTATANVADLTRCYQYPRVKRQAERDARAILDARVVRIGLLFDRPSELPGGSTVATSVEQLGAFLQDWEAGSAQNELTLLCHLERRPFSSAVEALAHRVYGLAMRACAGYPCLLRPVDLALRAAGWRWYGYLFLSGRAWSTT